jgi:hypothetical protein
MPDDDSLPFKVVRTNSHDEIVACTCNLIVWRAAYETARRLGWPSRPVIYRSGNAAYRTGRRRDAPDGRPAGRYSRGVPIYTADRRPD